VATEFQACAGMSGNSAALTRTPERVAREGYQGLKQGRRVVVPAPPTSW
jgi:hypothetical protein